MTLDVDFEKKIIIITLKKVWEYIKNAYFIRKRMKELYLTLKRLYST